MVRINNKRFNKAVNAQAVDHQEIAIEAGASLPTLRKLMGGGTDLQLRAVERLAKHVGLGVEVRFFPLPTEQEVSA